MVAVAQVPDYKAEQQQRRRLERQGYTLKKIDGNTGMTKDLGLAWNPLLGYPRNFPCHCGSQKKFKHCCVNTMSPTVTKQQAITFNKYLKDIGAKK